MTIDEVIDRVKPEIKNLRPYSSARSEFTGDASVFLDANENPYGYLNRYPDPLQSDLKNAVCKLKGVKENSLFIGNGSDEAIDLILRVFCRSGKDTIMICPPTYGMYEVAAQINGVAIVNVPLNSEFQPDVQGIIEAIDRLPVDSNPLLFLCSPNNPTGNLLQGIAPLISSYPGIVVLDEAYIDFSPGNSFLPNLDEYPNLIILQTLSKAWGIAGVRIGIAFAHPEIISLLSKVKMPYNVSTPNQITALRALKQSAAFFRQIDLITKEKTRVISRLRDMSIVKRIYPSDANFLLVEFEDADSVYAILRAEGIIVRNRTTQISQTLRITIGTPEENDQLLSALNGSGTGLPKSLASRSATVRRKTHETIITVSLDLDGTGEAFINTGIGFFDHMLEQLTRHSGINLSVLVTGDLHIDEHHSIEDTALALGEAFFKALGDKRGIQRYGFLLPMDDCLAQVAIDFGGRPWIVCDVELKREKIGDFPTELFFHFFKSFSDKALCNLNISATGGNEHHKIEAVFKAFGRAVRMAVAATGNDEIPSTKGVL